jgi:hypothetical protein
MVIDANAHGQRLATLFRRAVARNWHRSPLQTSEVADYTNLQRKGRLLAAFAFITHPAPTRLFAVKSPGQNQNILRRPGQAGISLS